METNSPKTTSQNIRDAKNAFSSALEDPNNVARIKAAVKRTRSQIESTQIRLTFKP